MENNLVNKSIFFAQYLRQRVAMKKDWEEFNDKEPNILDPIYLQTGNHVLTGGYLLLKPLSSITDEELIHVARLAHERPNHDFKVTRNKDIFYAKTEYDSIGISYFISILPAYASVCATMNFAKFKDEGFKSNTVNIGKVNLAAERPIGYIAIVDYLRSKSYAIPFNSISVKKQIEYGWIKLIEDEKA